MKFTNFKNRRVILLFVFMVITTVAVTTIYIKKKDLITAKNGVINISAEELERAPLVVGEWNFRYQDEDFLKTVPGNWRKHVKTEKQLPDHGVGEYSLKVRFKELKKQRINLGIKTDRIESAFELYANGALLGGNGTVGYNEATSIPERRSRTFVFTHNPAKELQLKIVVSNYRHPLPGISRPVRIGSAKSINNYSDTITIIEILTVGVLMGNITLLLALYFTKRNIELLYSIIFFLTASLYLLTAGKNYIHAIIPLDWKSHQTLLHLLMSLPLWFYSAYLKHFFPSGYQPQFHRAIQFVVISYGIMILVTPPSFFINFVWFIHLAVIVSFIYWCFVLVDAVCKNHDYAILNLIGITACTATSITEILLQQYFIRANLFPIGLLIWGIATLIVKLLKEAKRANVAEDKAKQRKKEVIHINEEVKKKQKQAEMAKQEKEKIKELVKLWKQHPDLVDLVVNIDRISHIHGDSVGVTAFNRKGTPIVQCDKLRLKTIVESKQFPAFVQCSRNHLVDMNQVFHIHRQHSKHYLHVGDKQFFQEVSIGNGYIDKIENLADSKILYVPMEKQTE